MISGKEKRLQQPGKLVSLSSEILWEETLHGSSTWSHVLKRGTALRITAEADNANVGALFMNADNSSERLNLPDTLKAQHIARLTTGAVLYSDMGRILCSITDDMLGWHDPLGGCSDAALVAEKFGLLDYQEARNGMLRNARDGLLIELGKWGLSKRDLAATVNFFSKVWADGAGELHFVPGHSRPLGRVELRFEMSCLVALSTAPHPLEPRPEYAPGPVGLLAWRSGTARADDECRLSCPENGRGFQNTELYYR